MVFYFMDKSKTRDTQDKKIEEVHKRIDEANNKICNIDKHAASFEDVRRMIIDQMSPVAASQDKIVLLVASMNDNLNLFIKESSREQAVNTARIQALEQVVNSKMSS